MNLLSTSLAALFLITVALTVLLFKSFRRLKRLKELHTAEHGKSQNLYQRLKLQNEKLRAKELELENKNQALIIANLQASKENERLQSRKKHILEQQQELEQKTRAVTEQMEEIALQNEILLKQKSKIKKQKDKISIINDGLLWHNQIMEEANVKMQEQHKLITDSIRYARNIQEAMLPQRKTICESFPEHFIFFQPRELVSGDFYWYAKKNGYAFFAAVDCTGHGVPGAFMSMIANTFLRKAILEEDIYRPDKVLDLLHEQVQKTLNQHESKNMDGMDIALCAWNEKDRKLWYSGAKNPLWLIEENEISVIRGSRRPVGGFQYGTEISFRCHEISITGPTICYIFTDGFQDQFGGAAGRKYLTQNLKQFILSIAQYPLLDQKSYFQQEIANWMGSKYSQLDDILVIGFQIG